MQRPSDRASTVIPVERDKPPMNAAERHGTLGRWVHRIPHVPGEAIGQLIPGLVADFVTSWVTGLDADSIRSRRTVSCCCPTSFTSRGAGRVGGFAQVGLREVRRWTYQGDPLLSSIRAMVIHGMAVRTATPICAAAASTVGRPGPLRIRSGASESAASPHQSTRTARLAAIRIGAVGVGNAPRSTTNATASCVPVNEASNHRCSTTVE
jgi:hypothetical protein